MLRYSDLFEPTTPRAWRLTEDLLIVDADCIFLNIVRKMSPQRRPHHPPTTVTIPPRPRRNLPQHAANAQNHVHLGVSPSRTTCGGTSHISRRPKSEAAKPVKRLYMHASRRSLCTGPARLHSAHAAAPRPQRESIPEHAPAISPGALYAGSAAAGSPPTGREPACNQGSAAVHRMVPGSGVRPRSQGCYQDHAELAGASGLAHMDPQLAHREWDRAAMGSPRGVLW